MSGRSASNRGKKSHKRSFESADGRQSSSNSNHSSKYGSSREPPPRFLNRPRNGDGRSNSGGDSKEYYDDYSSGRREGGGHRGAGGRQGNTGSPSSGGRSSNFGEFSGGVLSQDKSICKSCAGVGCINLLQGYMHIRGYVGPSVSKLRCSLVWVPGIS